VSAPLPACLRLIVILDTDAAGARDLAALAAAAERGGATMLQVRAKRLPAGPLAALVRHVITATRLPVVVNDRLDVAIAAGAAGCHLGQDDLPLPVARELAPAGFLLGGSAGSEAEGRRAAQGGAHYVGVGPIHGTGNKPDAGEAIGAAGLGRVVAAGSPPAVAIGGVGAADVPAVVAAGAVGVAVIGAVLLADDPERATRALRTALDRALP
jgi:thiamine-phosphate pyrophosphorylase